MSKCILCDTELTEMEEYNGELFCVACDGPYGSEVQSLENFDAFRSPRVPAREGVSC